MKIFYLTNKKNIDNCINEIKSINFNKISQNYVCYIDKADNLKTKQQCSFFHKLLEEFVKTGISNIDGFNSEIGYWKYFVKKQCNFYNTKKGCLFTKDRQLEIYNHLKTLPDDIQKDIYNAMTMNMKSISEATIKELNILISCLINNIVDILGKNVLCNDFLSSSIEENYNHIMISNSFNDEFNIINNDKFIELCEKQNLNFKFNEDYNRYCLVK